MSGLEDSVIAWGWSLGQIFLIYLHLEKKLEEDLFIKLSWYFNRLINLDYFVDKMLNLKEYIFKRYSKDYPLLFKKEKIKLQKILPKAKMEHIGSSAVIGLGWKGIIDIVITVPKSKIQKSIKILQLNGYDYRSSGNNKERTFFQKIIKYFGKERRIHLQLTFNNSYTFRSMIAVRDYLNKNEKVAKEYSKIKKQAVKHANGEGKKYRDYKKAFLSQVVKDALK